MVGSGGYAAEEVVPAFDVSGAAMATALVVNDGGGTETWVAVQQPELFYVSRSGFNDIAIYRGDQKPSKKDQPVYFVDVASKALGWQLVLYEGPDAATGKPLLVISKAFFNRELLGIDKGSYVTVRHHEESDAGKHAAEAAAVLQLQAASAVDDGGTAAAEANGASVSVNGNPANEGRRAGKEKKRWYSNLNPKGWTKPAATKEKGEDDMAVMTRKQMMRSNRNEFDISGQRYEWDYEVLVGATMTCKSLDTDEVVAVCRLRPKHWLSTQTFTDWGFRIDGGLEVHGSGKQHLPIILATLAAMLEWRKHNNKVIVLGVVSGVAI